MKTMQSILETSPRYFEQYNGYADVTNGWKLSIQGKTIEDALFLYNRLLPLLKASQASYKLGTAKLINGNHPQQKHKLLTVYIPNGVDAKSFAELCYLNINDYKGGQDIKQPDSYEHYAGAIYFRNDRNEDGQYIPAN